MRAFETGTIKKIEGVIKAETRIPGRKRHLTTLLMRPGDQASGKPR
jgi:hypothetical protein